MSYSINNFLESKPELDYRVVKFIDSLIDMQSMMFGYNNDRKVTLELIRRVLKALPKEKVQQIYYMYLEAKRK